MEYPKWAQESGIKKAKRSARGARSRTAGNQFEAMIDAACEWYKAAGAAVIDKTPEPMRPISRPNRAGQFTACYTKQAQPDYKGAHIRAFDRMIEERKARGLATEWQTGIDAFNWWMEYDVLPGQMDFDEVMGNE